MGLYSLMPHIMWPKPVQSYQYSGMTLNGTTTKNGYVTIFPYTGTINNVLIRTRTVTTSQTLKVSLQGVGTDGKPDGTILGVGNSAYGTQGSLVQATVYTIALTSALSVTRGDKVAVVVEWNSTAGSITMSQGDGEVCNNFYTCTYTGGAWTITASGEAPIIGFEYTDGFHGFTTYPFAAITGTAFNNTSTPDEIGVLINNPTTIIACGAFLYVNKGFDCTVKLYDSADNVLASQALVPGNRWNAALAFDYLYFASDVTIQKNQNYRLTLVPDTASNVTLLEYTMPSASALNSLSLGSAFSRTSRTDAGAWTNNAGLRPTIGLLIRGMEGNLLAHSGMTGGING